MRFVHEFERRPLSRLRLQLPLRRGANGMRHKFSPHYWEAAILRFCRHFRHRADAKLSPYPCGAKRPGFRRFFAHAGFTQNFHRTHVVRNAPVSAAASLPGSRKTFTAPMWCETIRFPPLLRCRVHAKLSPYPWGAKRSGFLRCFDTGLTQKTYKYILKAPLKKRI